jgi:hypothetical protein
MSKELAGKTIKFSSLCDICHRSTICYKETEQECLDEAIKKGVVIIKDEKGRTCDTCKCR